jgi:hypothetical protein
LETLSILETHAILFCASSKKNVRSDGIYLLAAMLALFHRSKAFADCDIPSGKYERFIADARRAPSFITGFACIGNALRNIGVTIAEFHRPERPFLILL